MPDVVHCCDLRYSDMAGNGGGTKRLVMTALSSSLQPIFRYPERYSEGCQTYDKAT